MLPESHFLSLPRPSIFGDDGFSVSLPNGVADTTTLAAHDFDVDTRTGFMPPQVPVKRLPAEWEEWESALKSAIVDALTLGDEVAKLEGETKKIEMEKSERWREMVTNLPIISITNLRSSEILLRRAHLVLAWIMHFYVHSLPPGVPIRIPPPVTVPLLQVSRELQLPPVLTYSDDVLYNWHLLEPESCLKDEAREDLRLPTPSTIICSTTFTSTTDEAHFYLTSSRIELLGVQALDLMRSTMDEVFVGDLIALRRITGYLQELTGVIGKLKEMLLDVRSGCEPAVFYNHIRPWFRGEDSTTTGKWIFDGIELDPTLEEPVELSGPSAGQSSLIHALDIFLGVDEYSHGKDVTGQVLPTNTDTQSHTQKSAFLKRMQLYMPRHHRAFLNHLANNPRPLRSLIMDGSDPSDSKTDEESKLGQTLLQAYNNAIVALKDFRDAHMIIVTLYIINPAREARRAASDSLPSVSSANSSMGSNKEIESEYVGRSSEKMDGDQQKALMGTGGTDLVQFLKNVRDQTRSALLSIPSLTDSTSA